MFWSMQTYNRSRHSVNFTHKKIKKLKARLLLNKTKSDCKQDAKIKCTNRNFQKINKNI